MKEPAADHFGDMLNDVGLLGALVVCFLIALFLKDTFHLPGAWAYASAGVLLIAMGFVMRFSIGSFLLFNLFVAQMLVGSVELSTDGWIQNITGNIFRPDQGKFLFILTSLTMFALRFCVNFIEQRIGLSPFGILSGCALLACIGLNLTSAIATFGGAILALLVYAVGKTFFWPTMLAVASDRFPRTGAVAISIMGGIGMMSAGLIGTPGLGYAKDRFAAEVLRQSDPAALEYYQSTAPSHFLFFDKVYGFDGSKLSEVQKSVARARAVTPDPQAALSTLPDAQRKVYDASVAGDRKTLKIDAFIPLAMSVIYLLLLLYFRFNGGYREMHVLQG